MINYEEWLAEVNAMDRSIDSKEKIKVWSKYAWKEPLKLPPRYANKPVRHFGGERDGEIIHPKSNLI